MKKSLLITIGLALSMVPLSWAFAGPPITLINSCLTYISSPGKYKLSQDITCAGTHGIIIYNDAKRIKLSLDGYTINGNSLTGTGIWVQHGSRVTISGPGRITGFSTGGGYGIQIGGISPGPVSQVSISGLIVDGNNNGIRMLGNPTDVSSVNITNNIVIDNVHNGISIYSGTHDSVIKQNEVLNNGSDGIIVANTGTDNNTVANNNASFNGDDNIIVGSNSVGTVIDGNIAIYTGGTEDIGDDGVNTTVVNNTCYVGRNHSDCDEFSDLYIDH